MTWEKGRQLKTFDNISYEYNANGIRTAKTVVGVRHEYDLEGSNILRESDALGNVIVPLYDGEEQVCGMTYNGELFFFHKNLQGDIIAITDHTAAVVARYSYDAWGKCTILSDTSGCEIATVNPFRYRGYYYDAEIGMYYLQSRYYNPEVGRFVNSDDPSILFPTSNQCICVNFFAYCYNNPINLSDPTGYQPKWAQVVGRYAKGTLAYKTFLLATKKGWFSNLFWASGFFRTSDRIYHTRQDCLQSIFGYNNFYDWAFDLGTDMRKAKFPFFSGKKEYIFWAWKGDYLNLGAGAELGIYSRLVVNGKRTGHWRAETKSALSMSMTLKYKGKVIATYKPRKKQWWITSFNPYYQNANASSISVVFNIKFSANKSLFQSFYNKFETGKYKSPMWRFDKKSYKATFTF